MKCSFGAQTGKNGKKKLKVSTPPESCPTAAFFSSFVHAHLCGRSACEFARQVRMCVACACGPQLRLLSVAVRLCRRSTGRTGWWSTSTSARAPRRGRRPPCWTTWRTTWAPTPPWTRHRSAACPAHNSRLPLYSFSTRMMEGGAGFHLFGSRFNCSSLFFVYTMQLPPPIR